MKTSLKVILFCDKGSEILAWPGKMSSWLILLIIAAVLTSVVASILDVSVLASWENPILLLDKSISLNSLMDIQWHLYGIMILLTCAFAAQHNRHVRVDVFSSKYSRKTAYIVEAIGIFVLLVPFCVFVVLHSKNLVFLSYRLAESSSEFGLTHRYLIKSFVPLGFALLGFQGVLNGVSSVLKAFTNYHNSGDIGDIDG